MKIEKIDRVSIMVNDLDKAVKFFSELLETDFTSLGDVEDMDLRSMVEPSGIEVVSPLSPDGASARTLKNRGEGLAMMALKVVDIKQAMAEMESRRIRLIGHSKTDTTEVAIYHPKDAFGVLIELVAYETKHPVATAMGK